MLACALALPSSAQVAFGVSPMIGLNSAYVGYNVKNMLVPFIGISSVGFSGNFVQEGEEYDYDELDIVDYENVVDIKVRMLVPTIGVKYFFNPTNLRPYVVVAFSKPIFSGALDMDNKDAEDAFDDVIDNIKIFQTEIAFGGEYFVADNFSVGGEFGLRMMRGNFMNTYETEVYNPQTNEYIDSEVVSTFNVGLTPTYTKIYLNFYFGGGDEN